MSEMLFFLTQSARKRGDYPQARAYIEECLQLRRGLGDQDGEGGALWEVGMLEFLAGRLEQALAAFQTSQAYLTASGTEEIAILLNRFYAWMALARGDLAQARHYSQLQWDLSSAHFIPWLMIDALGLLGWVALSAGEVEHAVQSSEKALVLLERPDRALLVTARYVLARVALARGQAARARGFLHDFITDNYYSWPPVQLGFQLSGMLAVQGMAGQPALALRAATLFGAQAALEDSLRWVIPAAEWQAYQQSLAELRAFLSPADFSAAWAAGQALTFEQACAYALEEGFAKCDLSPRPHTR